MSITKTYSVLFIYQDVIECILSKSSSRNKQVRGQEKPGTFLQTGLASCFDDGAAITTGLCELRNFVQMCEGIGFKLGTAELDILEQDQACEQGALRCHP